MKKHSRKHNHMKAIIIIVAALIGLYVISVRPDIRNWDDAARRLGEFGDVARTRLGNVYGESVANLQKQLQMLQQQWNSAQGREVRARIQAQMDVIRAEISRRASGLIRPMS